MSLNNFKLRIVIIESHCDHSHSEIDYCNFGIDYLQFEVEKVWNEIKMEWNSKCVIKVIFLIFNETSIE